ncbi:MAG: hypothetical protein WAS52_00330 [Enterococcus aquimarinus]
MKKRKVSLFLLVASMTITSTAFAAMHQSANGRSWVKNTENWTQLSYFGEAYTLVGGSARISYFRSNKPIGSITAYVTNGSSDYKSITIRDSLNPIAPKTKYSYGF